jgi:Transglycosylase SLT domain
MLSSLGPFSRMCLTALALGTVPLARPVPASAEPAGSVLVARYADALGTANARLSLAARRDLAERLLLLSTYYKIDPSLLAALVTVESAWRERAVSPVGALGYGQLMPGTASALHVDPLEAYENLDGTARYLRRMLNRYAGRDGGTRMQLALASYNAGAGAVDRWHGIPPYRETQAYVSNVLRVRRTFVASVGTRMSNDIAPLLARATTSPRRVALRHGTAAGTNANRHRAARRLASASAAHSRRTAYVDAADPNGATLATPPPVRYETSRSFVARFFGLRHRVSGPPAPSTEPPQPDLPAIPSGAY